MDGAVGETDLRINLPVMFCGAKYYRLLSF
jgi:hypothetical protein